MNPLRMLITSAYQLLVMLAPGLAKIPLDAFWLIMESVEIGIREKLKPEGPFHDTGAVFRFMREFSEAAVDPTYEQRVEACYWLLVVATNVEDVMTLDEFKASVMAHTPGVTA